MALRDDTSCGSSKIYEAAGAPVRYVREFRRGGAENDQLLGRSRRTSAFIPLSKALDPDQLSGLLMTRLVFGLPELPEFCSDG